MSTKREIASAIWSFIRAHTLKAEAEMELLDIVKMCLKAETPNHRTTRKPRRKQDGESIDPLTVITRNGKRINKGTFAAARRFGVTPQHLYLVIRGDRKSPRIERWLKRNMTEAGR